MANSKNTIQNIPLASELCMNALKTEVKQFQGYNEKNTTFYGGTLSPMWDNKRELPFDKDNSYTFFNSKGRDFTLVKERNSIGFYKGTDRVSGASAICETEKLDVPADSFMAAKCPDGGTMWVTTGGEIYKDGTLLKKVVNDFILPEEGEKSMIDCQVYFYNGLASLKPDKPIPIIIITYNHSTTPTPGQWAVESTMTNIYAIGLDGTVHRVLGDWQGSDESEPTFINDNTNKVPFVSFGGLPYLGPDVLINYCKEGGFFSYGGGIGTVTTEFKTYLINVHTFEVSEAPDEAIYKVINVENLGAPGTQRFNYKIDAAANGGGMSLASCRYIEFERFAGRILDYANGYRYTLDSDQNKVQGYVPSPESGKRLACPLGTNDTIGPASSSYLRWATSIYYKDGEIISIGCFGQPIAPALSFTSKIITPYADDGGWYMLSYKSGNNWYCYKATAAHVYTGTDTEYLKSFVVDDRYVFLRNYNMSNHGDALKIYDIETNSFMKEQHLDWILSDPVFTNGSGGQEVKGVVYAAGVNAGYPISNASLIGYLPNPYIGKVWWGSRQHYMSKYIPPEVQTYFTIGDTTQSAGYQGLNVEYKDTTYPIDPNGNVVLPISMNAQVIEGYSNNDMVKEGNTVYPMIYWNNNQKVYAYYLLAGIENITNVFSLQGQQYAVDDENIYALAFNGGVVSQVQSVSYKKNLTFLGTLPTQAVFWSDFNKTFYAFTGDRILSKMFEASDIHKILYVGQNPSSLSLWVCTDTGIYVLSDTDQFKMDYISEMVEFQPKKTLLLTEGETNNEVHAVSLYLDEGEKGEMIPVKLETSYYGLGNEMKAVMDCWYLRLFDEKNTKGYVKAKVHTITDITRHTEEKTFEVNPSDYDENHIVYLRFQPKYQECVSMQLELETNLGIYQISLGVNTTDSTAQVSKFNF